MPILSNLDYPDVRAALDSDLSENDLPDTFINRKIFAPAAIQDVLDRDPDAATRTGDDGDRVKRAAIYFCAARLAPTVVRLTSLNVQTRDMSYQKPVFDPDERAAQLRNMAEEELAGVLNIDPARPEFFSVARGTRGK
jgi:hypothetical protein